MTSNRVVRIQLVIFLALTLVGVSIAGAHFAGIGADLWNGGRYVVRADFANSGGVFEGAEVTYRGVNVGRVTQMRPTKTGVDIALRLEGGRRIPSNVRATVANRSAIGEQYVDLVPEGRAQGRLIDGSEIPRKRTGVPISTNKLIYDVDRLVDSVPKDDLITVIDELGTAFSGTGRDLSRIIDSGNALIETADANVEQTIDLINDGRTVLRTQRESGSAIRSFSKDLANLSETIADSDADIRSVLDDGVEAAIQIRGFIDENKGDVPLLLANLTTTGRIVKARLDGVQHILIIYPYAVRGSYTVIDKDPETGDYTSHMGLQLALGPRACRKGYEGTEKRQPERTGEKDANDKARCDDPETTMRGVQNAPAPGAGDPDSRNSRSTGTGIAPYDPKTGQIGLPDEITTLGMETDRQDYLGEDSWKWYLIGPLGR